VADIPNRDELERQIARLLGKYNRKQLAELMELMKNNPTLTNVPMEFWDTSQRELVQVLLPFSEMVYLEAAARMLEVVPITIEWGLVNEEAAQWAYNYSTILAGQINQTSRQAVATSIRNAVAAFFEEGLSIDEITARLEADPKLSQLFTREVRDRLGRIYGPQRAEMIAVTETTRASIEGQRLMVDKLAEEGIRMVRIWLTARDDLVCHICEPRDGVEEGKGSGRAYWTRDMGPPAHPRCRCDERYVYPKE
jgi:hypothetical protein